MTNDHLPMSTKAERDGVLIARTHMFHRDIPTNQIRSMSDKDRGDLFVDWLLGHVRLNKAQMEDLGNRINRAGWQMEDKIDE